MTVVEETVHVEPEARAHRDVTTLSGGVVSALHHPQLQLGVAEVLRPA
jgi:hypothetical protein